MSSTFEKLIVYVSLICGALFALLTNGGMSYFADGDILRGVLFAGMTLLTLVGWVGPLFKRWRAVGVRSGLWLAVLFVVLSALNFIRENFVPTLPKLWP